MAMQPVLSPCGDLSTLRFFRDRVVFYKSKKLNREYVGDVMLLGVIEYES